MGRIVEEADVNRIFKTPQHPYTQALLRSVPGRETLPGSRLKVIAGVVPDPFQRIPGCPFHPRCEEAVSGKCDCGDPPGLLELKPGHKAACLVRQEQINRDEAE
jgi:peptide/nickel transport system ATP-binding protein